jgi:hypothetical protein
MSAFFLAPLVIVQRLPQLWFEALHPNPMVHDESRLAVTEKVEAFSEGLFAGHMAAMMAPMGIASEMMRGRSALSAALGAQKKITVAATKPIEKRLKHNLKRLSRRR